MAGIYLGSSKEKLTPAQAPLSSQARPDPAPLDTAHSCFWTPCVSQKEGGAEGTQQVTQSNHEIDLRDQARAEPGSILAVGVLSGFLLGFFSSCPYCGGDCSLLWWCLGQAGFPRVSRGRLHFPVLWDPGKMCFIKSEALNLNVSSIS